MFSLISRQWREAKGDLFQRSQNIHFVDGLTLANTILLNRTKDIP